MTNTPKLCIAVLFIISTTWQGLNAREIHVAPDGQGTTCSDSFPCAAPYAFDNVIASGDVAIFHPGTYNLRGSNGLNIKPGIGMVELRSYDSKEVVFTTNTSSAATGSANACLPVSSDTPQHFRNHFRHLLFWGVLPCGNGVLSFERFFIVTLSLCR